MKIVSSIFFCIALIGYTDSLAQLTISPNPVIIDDIEFSQFETIAYSTITNDDTTPKSLTWVRNEVSITDGWESAICDLNVCHFSFVNQASFELNGEGSGALDVHIYPNGIEGSAIIEVLVYNQADLSDAITGMYYFNSFLSAPERISEYIKIYPNPTTDFLIIGNTEEVSQLEVYDMSGKRIDHKRLNGNYSVDVRSYPSGTYIIRMLGVNNAPVAINLFVKN